MGLGIKIGGLYFFLCLDMLSCYNAIDAWKRGSSTGIRHRVPLWLFVRSFEDIYLGTLEYE